LELSAFITLVRTLDVAAQCDVFCVFALRCAGI
jgi:hypothetical protein